MYLALGTAILAIGGFWPSRITCFRCLAPVGNRRQQRETQALGLAPQRPPAVETTQRRAPATAPSCLWCASGRSAPRVWCGWCCHTNGAEDAAWSWALREICVGRLRGTCSLGGQKDFFAWKANGSLERGTAALACSHRTTKTVQFESMLSNFNSCRPSFMLGSRRRA